MSRVGVLALVAGLSLAACGSTDDATGPAAPATTAGASDAADTTVDSVEQDEPEESAPDESEPGDPAPENSGFPVTIEHEFGTTTIDAVPERVVSVGFNEHDFLLALGVTPVGLRDWYGDQPNGVWPWAQDELGDATPEVISADAINFEQVAALEPDLIVGVWSGMTDADYEILAAIAPTVAQPEVYDDFGTPWQEQTLILGEATGRVDEAEEVVADLEADFAEIRAAHPDWEGLEASVSFVLDGNPGAYTSQDTRSRVMTDLGFAIPEVNDSGGDDSFYLELTPEDLEPLDVGVLVWTYGTDAELDTILNDFPTRQSLAVVQEGREVFADPELTGAFSHASPLSLDFVLERLVPELEAALDGDPSTVSPSVVGADASSGDSSSDGRFAPDEQAAADAWAAVFDSTVDFDTKAASLSESTALRSTVEAYAAAGEGFGGIRLRPTAVTIEGDGTGAVVTYDVDFGGNVAYADQTGTIDLVDGVWTVSREEFCAFMSSARVACEP